MRTGNTRLHPVLKVGPDIGCQQPAVRVELRVGDTAVDALNAPSTGFVAYSVDLGCMPMSGQLYFSEVGEQEGLAVDYSSPPWVCRGDVPGQGGWLPVVMRGAQLR